MRIEPDSPLRLPRQVYVAPLILPQDYRVALHTVTTFLNYLGIDPRILLYRGCNADRLGHVKKYGTDRDDLEVACLNFNQMGKMRIFDPIVLARESGNPMLLMFDSRLMIQGEGFVYEFHPSIHPTAALSQVITFNYR